MLDLAARMLAVLCENVADGKRDGDRGGGGAVPGAMIDLDTGEVLERDLVGKIDVLERDAEGRRAIARPEARRAGRRGRSPDARADGDAAGRGAAHPRPRSTGRRRSGVGHRVAGNAIVERAWDARCPRGREETLVAREGNRMGVTTDADGQGFFPP
ncbi:MAG: hypothetical protein ACREM3_17650 [Candidatus Rokuibacteriota bacterium]